MTLIGMLATHTDLGGPTLSKSGTIHVTYVVAGGLGYVGVDGERITLPARVVIPYKDGVPTVPVELEPTRGLCAARWDIYPDEPAVTRRLAGFHTEIPDVAEVDFGDLITVDPETYLPNGATVSAWQAAILEVQQLRDDTVGAITDSGWDAQLVEDAVTAKGEAESARDEAVAAKELAEAVPAQVGDAVANAVTDQDIPGKVTMAVGVALDDADIPALVTGVAGPIVMNEVALQLPALIHPLGSANNPITDAAAIRPGFPKVFWQTSVEPVHWLDGDEWIEVAI